MKNARDAVPYLPGGGTLHQRRLKEPFYFVFADTYCELYALFLLRGQSDTYIFFFATAKRNPETAETLVHIIRKYEDY